MSANEFKITKVAGELLPESEEELTALVSSTVPLTIEGTVTNPSHSVTCMLINLDTSLQVASQAARMNGNAWQCEFGTQPPGAYKVQCFAPMEGPVTLSVTVE